MNLIRKKEAYLIAKWLEFRFNNANKQQLDAILMSSKDAESKKEEIKGLIKELFKARMSTFDYLLSDNAGKDLEYKKEMWKKNGANYWYWWADGNKLLIEIRKVLDYNNQAQGGAQFESFRENNNGIFVSESYGFNYFRESFLDDIQTITSKHSDSGRNVLQ